MVFSHNSDNNIQIAKIKIVLTFAMRSSILSLARSIRLAKHRIT